jgi:hypothetical protein
MDSDSQDAETPELADVKLAIAVADLRNKELDNQVKELEIQSKEFEAKYRKSYLRTWMTNPTIIAALIAAWATFTAGGITWFAGEMSARTQRELSVKKFQSDLVINAIKTGDPGTAATNLAFLIDTGLLPDGGGLFRRYLMNRKAGEGPSLSLTKPLNGTQDDKGAASHQ